MAKDFTLIDILRQGANTSGRNVGIDIEEFSRTKGKEEIFKAFIKMLKMISERTSFEAGAILDAKTSAKVSPTVSYLR